MNIPWSGPVVNYMLVECMVELVHVWYSSWVYLKQTIANYSSRCRNYMLVLHKIFRHWTIEIIMLYRTRLYNQACYNDLTIKLIL
jgi:hypothetical protein